MKYLLQCAAYLIVISAVSTLGFARRGNPGNMNTQIVQMFIVDSDDNHPRTPTYQFVDTMHDASKWVRVTGFTNLDNGWAAVSSPDSFRYNFMGESVLLPPKYFRTNGYVGFDSAVTATQNRTLPTGLSLPYNSMIAGLWSDMELRTTGDSSKVFYRMTSDSCYITFYNLFLKNTNGKISATFQIAFANVDSSVTIHYRSFDGNMSGIPAVKIFQEQSTIGVQNFNGTSGSTYLDRGTYYARSYGSSIYAKDLHTGLAVKFMRQVNNSIRVTAITVPPSEGYELTSNIFTPTYKIENLTNGTRKIVATKVVTDLTTGLSVYSRTDSLDVDQGQVLTHSGGTQLGWKCGTYRLSVTISVPSYGVDPWIPDNIMTRDFTYVAPLVFPLIEEFASLDRCTWVAQGANIDSSHLLFIDPPAPVKTQSLLMNRVDAKGRMYADGAGDTMTTAPIDMVGKTNVWLIFSYQRSARADSSQAGINNRTLSGPETLKDNGSGGIIAGDSLVIEAIPSSAASYNPSPTAWVTIGKIYGGHDILTKKFRLLLPSAYVHNHTRIRFRVIGKNDAPLYPYPIEDQDNFCIDALQITAPEVGKKLETDVEVTGMEMGAGNYNRVPRNVVTLFPKVRIASNGLSVNSAFYRMRLVMKDQLGREIYHKVQSFIAPASRSDTFVTMPTWDIQGAQGGVFTAKATIDQNFTDYNRNNDTSSFTRDFNIDDMYGYDDGVPDTAGSMLSAEGNFTYLFKPLVNDSLRGFSFFHLAASGTTNWQVTFTSPSGNQFATRAFSYNALTKGWNRQTFPSVYLRADSIYKLHFTMTQGNSLGGDASKSLMWVKTDNGTSKKYDALYLAFDTLFLDADGAPYFNADAAKNIAGGGPLLPMMRIIFSGSSQYLPVELVHFSAKRMNAGDVALNFRTAKEENLYSYEIERESLNGDGWVNIASVIGKNSLNGASYSSFDMTAPRSSVTYRLWETDLDGSRNIIGTTTAAPFGEALKLALTLYPNPTQSEVQATVMGTGGELLNGSAGLTLFDALGRSVLTRNNISDGTFVLDLSALAGGSYYLELSNGGESVRQKIVVAK